MASTSKNGTVLNDSMDENSSTAQIPSIIPGHDDINQFSQKTLQAVLRVTKSSNDLPVGDDFDFYSTFKSVRDVMNIEGGRILSLMQRLFRHEGIKGNLAYGSTELEEKFDTLMDANDQILEKAGSLLDEASGIKKEETKLVIASTVSSKPTASWNRKQTGAPNAASVYKLITARNIPRPQLKFKDGVDNSKAPFIPKIKHKPNASISLKESLRLPDGVSLDDMEKPDFVYPHPYKHELTNFTPQASQLNKVEPKDPPPVNLTPLVMVDTVEQLRDMISELRKQPEIAVDLEAHSYRSFQGFTCLMQISTRTHDYIVDTLLLRHEMHQLNQVYTDPSIVKVLHGADSDIVWLQRDFGVYIVNLFDTGQAARLLNFPRFSLAHLMSHFCRREPDKQFQLADWRIRPLPSELINYAREDTHYLLYIYDMMRNQLIEQGNQNSNLILSVYDRSRIVAEKVYQKPIFTDKTCIDLYQKSKKLFSQQQMAALKDLCAWRDAHARDEDESLPYILPNHMLLQIAEILPRERQGVLACCNPVPPLVRQNLPELHGIVLRAREITTTGKLEKVATLNPTPKQHPRYDANSLLNCPHDMSHQHLEQPTQDIATDVASITNQSSMFQKSLPGLTLKHAPVISAFYNSVHQKLNSFTKRLADDVKSTFSSPFFKFFPKTSKLIEPKNSDLWTLKPNSGVKRVAGSSDQGKVELDSFQPEFVPPSKKAKISINVANSRAKATSVENTKLIQESVQENIKTLREEVSVLVKKEKQKLEVQKNKHKKSKQSENNQASNNENISDLQNVLSSSVEVVAGTSCPTLNEGKQKKRNKKVKTPGTGFKSFDYDTAEKQLHKEQKTRKKADIYNPSLPSRNSKDGARKKKLAGSRSKMSVSFVKNPEGHKKK